MIMNKPQIFPENSAQGTNSKGNPFVRPILESLTGEKRFGLRQRVQLVDLGCGKLRHLRTCMEFAGDIILVDTKRQIERVQRFAEMFCTMSQYVDSVVTDGFKIAIQTIDAFEEQQHNVDIVLSVAVMDVVLKKARAQMIRASMKNLRPGGYFVVIVPRNDSSILVNCKDSNRFEDGYVFRNRGHDNLTFYTNFRDPSSLLKMLKRNGFSLVEDRSVFRQICYLLQKPR